MFIWYLIKLPLVENLQVIGQKENREHTHKIIIDHFTRKIRNLIWVLYNSYMDAQKLMKE